ncbi:MAG: VCBS repeat-containing protein, partial [Planctomycetes bacterium]|nr:VCBS repeat-containing protein [Planctomycetota bacterium]
MKTDSRIHRRLWVEELEPRVAPATLQWVGDVVTLHQGDSVTFSDFDGDVATISVDSLTGNVADTTAEVYIRRGADPDAGGGYYIDEISFVTADANTQLLIDVGAPGDDTGTFVANINDDRSVDTNGDMLPVTVGEIDIEGTVGDVTLGAIDSRFRLRGIFTPDGYTHFDGPGYTPYTMYPDSMDDFVLDAGAGFDAQLSVEHTGPLVGPVGPPGGQGTVNSITIEGGDFGAGAAVSVVGSIRHFTLGAGSMVSGSVLESETAIDEIEVHGSIEAGVSILEGDETPIPGYPGYGGIGRIYVTGDLMADISYQSFTFACPLEVEGTLGGSVRLARNWGTMESIRVGTIGSTGSLIIGGAVGPGTTDTEQYVMGDVVVGSIEAGGLLQMERGNFYGDVSILGDLDGTFRTGNAGAGLGRVYGTLYVGGDIGPTGLIETLDPAFGMINRLEVAGDVLPAEMNDDGTMAPGGTINVASWIAYMEVHGDGGFQGNLNVGGGMIKMTVDGGDLGGAINVTGSVQQGIEAMYDVADANINVGGTLAGLTVHGNIERDVTVTTGGDLGILRVYATGPLGGDMAGQVYVGGNLTNAVIQNDFSGTISVAGDVGGVEVGKAGIGGDFLDQALLETTGGNFTSDIIIHGDFLGQIQTPNDFAATADFQVMGTMDGRVIADGAFDGAVNLSGDLGATGEIYGATSLGIVNIAGNVLDGSRIGTRGSWVGGTIGGDFGGNIDVTMDMLADLTVGGNFTGNLGVGNDIKGQVVIGGNFVDGEILAGAIGNLISASSFSGGQIGTSVGDIYGRVLAVNGDLGTPISSAGGIMDICTLNGDLTADLTAWGGDVIRVEIHGDIAPGVTISAPGGNVQSSTNDLVGIPYGVIIYGQVLGRIDVGRHPTPEFIWYENIDGFGGDTLAAMNEIYSFHLFDGSLWTPQMIMDIAIDGAFGLDADGCAYVDLYFPTAAEGGRDIVSMLYSKGITYRNLTARNIHWVQWSDDGTYTWDPQVSVAGTLTLGYIGVNGTWGPDWLEFQDVNNIVVTDTGMTGAYMRVHGDLTGDVTMNGPIPSYDPTGNPNGGPTGIYVDGAMSGYITTGVTLNSTDTYTFVENATTYTYTFNGASTGINLNGRDRYSNGEITIELHDAQGATQTVFAAGLPAGFVERNINFTGDLQVNSLAASLFRPYGIENMTVATGALTSTVSSYTNIGSLTLGDATYAYDTPILTGLVEALGNDGTDGSIGALTITSGAISGTVRAQGDFGAITLDDGQLASTGVIETIAGDFAGEIQFLDPDPFGGGGANEVRLAGTIRAVAGSFLRNMAEQYNNYQILYVQGHAEGASILAGQDILGKLYFWGHLQGVTIDAGGKIGDSEYILTNGFNDDQEPSGLFDEDSEVEDTDVIYVREEIGPQGLTPTTIHANSLEQRIRTDAADGFRNTGDPSTYTVIDIDEFIIGRIQATGGVGGVGQWGNAYINLEVGDLSTLGNVATLGDEQHVIRTVGTWLFVGDKLGGNLNIYGDVSGDIALGLWQTTVERGTVSNDTYLWIGGTADDTFDLWACYEVGGQIAIRRLEGDIYTYQGNFVQGISAQIVLGNIDSVGSTGRGRILVQQSSSSHMVPASAGFSGSLYATEHFDSDNSGGVTFGMDLTETHADEGNFNGRLLVWNGGDIGGQIIIDKDLGTSYSRLDQYGLPYGGLISTIPPGTIGQYNDPTARGRIQSGVVQVGGMAYGMLQGYFDLSSGGYTSFFYTEDGTDRYINAWTGAIDLSAYGYKSYGAISGSGSGGEILTIATVNGLLRDSSNHATFELDFQDPLDTPWRICSEEARYSFGGTLDLTSYSIAAGDAPLGDAWAGTDWLSRRIANDFWGSVAQYNTRPYNIGSVTVNGANLDVADAPIIMAEHAITGTISYNGTIGAGDTFTIGQGSNEGSLPLNSPNYLVAHTVNIAPTVTGTFSVEIHGELGLRVGKEGWMDDPNGIATIWLDTGAGITEFDPWLTAGGPSTGDVYVQSTLGYFDPVDPTPVAAQRMLGYVGDIRLSSLGAGEQFAAFNIGNLRIATGNFDGELTVARNLAREWDSSAAVGSRAEKLIFEDPSGIVSFGGTIIAGGSMFNLHEMYNEANSGTSDAQKDLMLTELQQDLTLGGGTFSGTIRAGNEIGNVNINGDMDDGHLYAGSRVASVGGFWDRIGGLLIEGNMINSSDVIAGDSIATGENLQVRISSWMGDPTKDHIGMDSTSKIDSLAGTIALGGGWRWDKNSYYQPAAASELKPEDLVLIDFGWSSIGNSPRYYTRGVLIRGGGSLNGTIHAGGQIGQISIKHTLGDANNPPGGGDYHILGEPGPGGTYWVGGFGPDAAIISDTMRTETIYIQGVEDPTRTNLRGGKGHFEGQLYFAYESPTVFIGTPAGRYGNAVPLGGDMSGAALISSGGWDMPLWAMRRPAGGTYAQIDYENYSETRTGQLEGDIHIYNGNVGPNVVIQAEGDVVGWVVVGTDNSADHSSPYGGNFYGTLKSLNGDVQYGINAAGDFGGTIIAENGSLGNGGTLMDIEGSILPGATIWAADDINGNIYVGVDTDDASYGEYVGGVDAAYALTTGDVDKDGDIDIVTGHIGSPSRVFLNDGAGTFANGIGVSLDVTDTRAVALGDVNGDGALDLVTGNYNQSNRLYLGRWDDTIAGGGNNNGMFDAGETWLGFRVGVDIALDADNTRAIAVADIDGDGLADVIVGNYGEVNKWYRGNGDGTFQAAVNITGDVQNTTCVAVDDLNPGGNVEILFGNYGQVNRVYQYAAGFSTWRNVTGDANNTTDVAIADINEDGRLDVVVANYNQTNRFYANNAGSFAAGVNISGNVQNTEGIAVADMDGDLHLDIVVGNLGQVNRLYRGNGAGGFTPGEDISGDTWETHDIALVELDGALGPDVVAANAGASSRIYYNSGGGAFVAGLDISADTDDSRAIATADMNNDGDLDVVVGNYGEANKLYLGNGDGTFGPGIDIYAVTGYDAIGGVVTTTVHTDNTTSVAIADMNYDGNMDVIVANDGQVNRVYWGDGNGGFTIFQDGDPTQPIKPWESSETENTTCVAVADVTGDGVIDIVVGNSGAQVNRIYAGQFIDVDPFNGQFDPGEQWNGIAPNGTAIGGPSNTQAVALGDADTDSDLDIFFGNVGQTDVIHMNLGGGAFGAAQQISADTYNTYAIAVGDFNNDNDLDVVTGNLGQVNRYYQGNGNGTFAAGTNISADTGNTRGLSVGLIDGDGNLDIVVANDGGTTRIYRGNGNGTFQAGADVAPDADNSYDVVLGDVNDSGQLDMFVANSGQANKVYFNSGGQAFGNAKNLNTTVTIHAGRDFIRGVQLLSLGDFYNVNVDVGRDFGGSVVNGGAVDYSGYVLYAARGGFLDTSIDIARDMRGTIYSRIDKAEIYSLEYDHPNSILNTPAGVSRWSYGGFHGGADYSFSGGYVTNDSNVDFGGHIRVGGDWTAEGEFWVDGHIFTNIDVVGDWDATHPTEPRDGDFYGRIRVVTYTGDHNNPNREIAGDIRGDAATGNGRFRIYGDFYDPDGFAQDNMSNDYWLSWSRADTLPGGQIITYSGDINNNIYIGGDFVSGRIGAGMYTTWTGGFSSSDPYYWSRDIGRDFLLDVQGGMQEEAYLLAGYDFEAYTNDPVIWDADTGMADTDYLQESQYYGGRRHYYSRGATIKIRGGDMAGTILSDTWRGTLQILGDDADLSGIVSSYYWMGNSEGDGSAGDTQRGVIFIRDGNLTGEVSGQYMGSDIWVRDGDFHGPGSFATVNTDDGVDNGNITGVIRAGKYIASGTHIITTGPVWYSAVGTPEPYWYSPSASLYDGGGNFSGTIFANDFNDANMRIGGSITSDAYVIAGRDLQANVWAGFLHPDDRNAQIDGSFWAGRDFLDMVRLYRQGGNHSWRRGGDFGDDFDMHVGRDYWGEIRADNGNFYGTIEVGRDFGGRIWIDMNWGSDSLTRRVVGRIGRAGDPDSTMNGDPYDGAPNLGAGYTFLTIGRDLTAQGDVMAGRAINASIDIGRDFSGRIGLFAYYDTSYTSTQTGDDGLTYRTPGGIYGDITIGRDMYVDYVNEDEVSTEYQSSFYSFPSGAGIITAARGSIGDPRYAPSKITIGRDFIGGGAQPENPNLQMLLRGSINAGTYMTWGNVHCSVPVQAGDRSFINADITIGRNMRNGATIYTRNYSTSTARPAMNGSLNVGYVYDDLGVLVPYREGGAAVGGLMDGSYRSLGVSNSANAGDIQTDFLIGGSIGPNGLIESTSGRIRTDLGATFDVGADPEIDGHIQGRVEFDHRGDATFDYTENGVAKSLVFTGAAVDVEISINGNEYSRTVEYVDPNTQQRVVIDLPDGLLVDQVEDIAARGDYIAFVGLNEASGYKDLFICYIDPTTGAQTLWNATNWETEPSRAYDQDSFNPMFTGTSGDWVVFGSKTYRSGDHTGGQTQVHAYQITGPGAGTLMDISQLAYNNDDAFNFQAASDYVVYEMDTNRYVGTSPSRRVYFYDLTTGVAGSPTQVVTADRPNWTAWGAQISYDDAAIGGTGDTYIAFNVTERDNHWAAASRLYYTTATEMTTGAGNAWRLDDNTGIRSYGSVYEPQISGHYVVATGDTGNYNGRRDIVFYDLTRAPGGDGIRGVSLTNNNYRGYRWGYYTWQTSASYYSFNPYINGDTVAFETDNYNGRGVREIEYVDLDPNDDGTPIQNESEVNLQQITFNDGLGTDIRGYGTERGPYRNGYLFPAQDAYDPVVARNTQGTASLSDDTYHIVFEQVRDATHTPEDGIRDVMWYDVGDNFLRNLTENTGGLDSYNYSVSGDSLVFQTSRPYGAPVAGDGGWTTVTTSPEAGCDGDGLITDIYFMDLSEGVLSLENLTNNQHASGRMDVKGSYEPILRADGMVVFTSDVETYSDLTSGLVTVRSLGGAPSLTATNVDIKHIYSPNSPFGAIDVGSIQGNVWAQSFGNVTTAGDVNNLFHMNAGTDMTSAITIGGNLVGEISTPIGSMANITGTINIAGDILSTGVIRPGGDGSATPGIYGNIASGSLTVGGSNYGRVYTALNGGGGWTDTEGGLARTVNITVGGLTGLVIADGTNGLSPAGASPFEVSIQQPVTANQLATGLITTTNADFGLGDMTINGWAAENITVYDVSGVVTIPGGIPGGSFTIQGDVRAGAVIDTVMSPILSGALAVGGTVDGQIMFSLPVTGIGVESFSWYEDYVNQGGAPALNNQNSVIWDASVGNAAFIDFVIGDGLGARNSIGTEGIVSVTVFDATHAALGSLDMLTSGTVALPGSDYLDFDHIMAAQILSTDASGTGVIGIQANSIRYVMLETFGLAEQVTTGIFEPSGAGGGAVGGDLGGFTLLNAGNMSGTLDIGRDLTGWITVTNGDLDGVIDIGRNIVAGAGIDPTMLGGGGTLLPGVLTVDGAVDGTVVVPNVEMWGMAGGFTWNEAGNANTVIVDNTLGGGTATLTIGTGDGRRNLAGRKGLVSLVVNGVADSVNINVASVTSPATPLDFLDITATDGTNTGLIGTLNLADGVGTDDASVLGTITYDIFPQADLATGLNPSVDVGELHNFFVRSSHLGDDINGVTGGGTLTTHATGGASGNVTGTVQSLVGSIFNNKVDIGGVIIGDAKNGGLVTEVGYFTNGGTWISSFTYTENGDTETVDLNVGDIMFQIGSATVRIGRFGTATGGPDGEGMLTIDAPGVDLSDWAFSGAQIDLTAAGGFVQDLILYDLHAKTVTLRMDDQHSEGTIRVDGLDGTFSGRIVSRGDLGTIMIEGDDFSGVMSGNITAQGATPGSNGDIEHVYFTNMGSDLRGGISAAGDIGSVEFLQGDGARNGQPNDANHHDFAQGAVVQAGGNIGYFKILDGWWGDNGATSYQAGFNGRLEAGLSIGRIDVGSYANRSVIGPGARILAGQSPGGEGGDIGDIRVYSHSGSGDYSRGGGITAGPNETANPNIAGVLISAEAGSDSYGDIGYISVMNGCVTSDDNDNAEGRYNTVAVHADGNLGGVYVQSVIQGFWFVGDENIDGGDAINGTEGWGDGSADIGGGAGGSILHGFVSRDSNNQTRIINVAGGSVRSGDIGVLDRADTSDSEFDYEVFEIMDFVNGKVTIDNLPRATISEYSLGDFGRSGNNWGDLFRADGTVYGDIIAGSRASSIHSHYGLYNPTTSSVESPTKPFEFGALKGDIRVNGWSGDINVDIVIHNDYDGMILAQDRFYRGIWIDGDFGGQLITNPGVVVPTNGVRPPDTGIDPDGFMAGTYQISNLGGMRSYVSQLGLERGFNIYGNVERGAKIVVGGRGSLGMFWRNWGGNYEETWGDLKIDGNMDGLVRIGTRVENYGGNLNSSIVVGGDLTGVVDISGSITKAYWTTASNRGYMSGEIDVAGQIRSGAVSVGSSYLTGGKGGVIMGPITSHGHALDGSSFMYSEDGVSKSIILDGPGGGNTADITIDGGHMLPLRYENLDLTSGYEYSSVTTYNGEAFIMYYDNNWTVRDTGTYAVHTSGDFDTTRTQNGIGPHDLHAQVSLSLSSAAGIGAGERVILRNADLGDMNLGVGGDIAGLLQVDGGDVVGTVLVDDAATFVFNTAGIDVSGTIGDIRRVGNRTLAQFSNGGIFFTGGSLTAGTFGYRNGWDVDRVYVTGTTINGLSLDTVRNVDAPVTEPGVTPAAIDVTTSTGMGLTLGAFGVGDTFTTLPGTKISGLTAAGRLQGAIYIDGDVVPGGEGIRGGNNEMDSGILTVTGVIRGKVQTYLDDGVTFTYFENGEQCDVTVTGIDPAAVGPGGEALFVINGESGSEQGLGVGPYMGHGQASLTAYRVQSLGPTGATNIEVFEDKLVYERSGNIYYWTGSGQVLITLPGGYSQPQNPTIHGGYIAFEAWDGDDWDILRYQFNGSTVTYVDAVSELGFAGGDNNVDDRNVDNYNDTFVWQRVDPDTLATYAVTEWDIIYFDGSAEQVYTDDNLTFNPAAGDTPVDDVNPSIHNTYVTWEHLDTNKGLDEAGLAIPDDWDIYYRRTSWAASSTRNISDGDEDNLRDDLAPDSYSSRAVFQANDGNDFEIFFYDGYVTTQLTNNNVDDMNPSLYDWDVAFARGDYDEGTSTWLDGEIYLYEETTGAAKLVDLGAMGDGNIDIEPDLYEGGVAWRRDPGGVDRIMWRPPSVYLGADMITANNVQFAQIGDQGTERGVEVREMTITNADVGTIFLGQFDVNDRIWARDVYNITQSENNDRYFIDGQIRVHRIGRDGADGGTITVGRGGIGPVALIESETDIGTLVDSDGIRTAGFVINNHAYTRYAYWMTNGGRIELDNWQSTRSDTLVTFTQGTPTVTLSLTGGDDWETTPQTIGAGSVISGPDGRFYTIQARTGATTITLTEVYHGETVTTRNTRITTLTGSPNAAALWTGNENKIVNRLLYFGWDWGYHRVKSVDPATGVITPWTTSFTWRAGDNVGGSGESANIYDIGMYAQGIAQFNGGRSAVIKARGLDGSNGDIASIIFDDAGNDLRGVVEAAGSIGDVWAQDGWDDSHYLAGKVTAKTGSIGNVHVVDSGSLQGQWSAAQDIGWVMIYNGSGFSGTNTLWEAGGDFGGIYMFEGYVDNYYATIKVGGNIGTPVAFQDPTNPQPTAIYAPRMGASNQDFCMNLIAGGDIGDIYMADGRLGFGGGYSNSYVFPVSAEISAGGNIGNIHLGTYYGVLGNTTYEQVTDASFGISDSVQIISAGSIGDIDVTGNIDGVIKAGTTIGSGLGDAIVVRSFEQA